MPYERYTLSDHSTKVRPLRCEAGSSRFDRRQVQQFVEESPQEFTGGIDIPQRIQEFRARAGQFLLEPDG